MNVDNQVGGNHYRIREGGEEHWDRVHRLQLNWFQANITKYVERCYLKDNILLDLYKAKQYLEKLIDIEQRRAKQAQEGMIRDYDNKPENDAKPGRNYVNQDKYDARN